MTTRILVTGDTHVPDFARDLPPTLLRAAARSDLILHAGDVTNADVLERLAACAPVRAALGNNDRPDVEAWGAEAEVRLEIDGAGIAMIHDGGRRERRETRLAARFPEAHLIVFGHSHIPMLSELDGRTFVNPGSPTWKRRQPRPTYATITISAGRIRMRLIEI